MIFICERKHCVQPAQYTCRCCNNSMQLNLASIGMTRSWIWLALGQKRTLAIVVHSLDPDWVCAMHALARSS